MDDKFRSRKYYMTLAITGLMVALPMVYRLLGISDPVTLAVEAALAAAGGVYNVTNVIGKKYEGVLDPPMEPHGEEPGGGPPFSN